MLRQMERIGLGDSPQARTLLEEHLNTTLNNPSSSLRSQENGRVIRESLLMGPRGGVSVESIWQGNRLITIILRGAGQ